MPTAEKITGGEVYLRGIDQRVSIAERVDVSEEFADYLVGERGDFEIVDVDASEERSDEQRTDTVPVDDAIDAGDCPWCDEYSGDAVGQHAASAHPDEWDTYKED